jgi:cyclopropane-fatty-acyl-phospholipid synthase
MTLSKKLFLKTCEKLRGGSLELLHAGETHRFGDPNSELQATICVNDQRFFKRAVFGGDVAIGESFMDNDWSSPDLVSVVRLAVRNLAPVENTNRLFNALARTIDIVRHRGRANSVSGSKRNIGAHYDLSNDFFRLFLDPTMMYSCAFYETPDDSLETAQFQKLERICRRLRLGPEDHVLEIGTGWGAFALHAVRHYGCRVTTTTISREQHDLAEIRFGGDERIDLKLEDYRHLKGKFDKIVSIEMFEAVGLNYYDEFFRACNRLLTSDGTMLMQTITMNERTFPTYRRRADWIQKYIFPGSELASVSEILRSLARVSPLSLFHAEEIGMHYARTLASWRERFQDSIDSIRELGFDDRFLRMWDYYLAYCEGAFLERHVGDMQLLLTKAANRNAMFNEPWESAADGMLAKSAHDRHPSY